MGLEARISANIDDFQRNLNRARQAATDFSQKASKSFEKLGQSIQSIAIPAAAASLAISAIGLTAIKSYGQLQSLEKGLEAVAGSSEAAKAQLDELREVAKLPGLGLEEAVKGSIALQAIGVSASEAKRSILQFGNAIATVGKGRAELDRALYGLQQLANTDFPLGEDLNIIKDAIPQVSKLLTEAFGANRSDELAKMGITSKQVVETILTGLEKLPRVAGGIENAFENLGDGIKEAWQELGKAINEALNFEGVINKLGDAIGWIVEKFRELSPAAQKTIVYIGAGIAAFTGLVAALGAVITIAPLVSGALTLATGGIAALTAAIAVGAVAIANNWDTIKIKITEAAAYILNKIADLMLRMSQLASRLGLDAISNKLADATWNLKNRADGFAKSASNAKDELALLDEIQKNAKINADLLAKSNGSVATSLNKAGEAAKRAYKNFWALNGIQQTLNGKEITGKGVEQKKTIGSLDRGTSLNIKPNITGILTETQVQAEMAADAFNEKFSEVLGHGISDAISDLASGIGDALMSGGNLIDSLGAVFLSSMGNILKQLGSMAIQVGIGIKAVKSALQSLNPVVAIAAGVALVAIGSAFSAGARNLGNSMGSGSGGGYSNSAVRMSDPSTFYKSAPMEIKVSGEFVQRGSDLYAVVERETSRNNRIR